MKTVLHNYVVWIGRDVFRVNLEMDENSVLSLNHN